MSGFRLFLAFSGVLLLSTGAYAQSMPDMPGMDHSSMPGMTMPATPAPAGGSMQGIDHSKMPGTDNTAAPAAAPAMDHSKMSGMDHSSMPGMNQGARSSPPIGSAPPPAAPSDHYADRDYPKADMERARNAMMKEQGGQLNYLFMLNLNEVQLYQGQAGYRWDGEAWFGGDINRLTLKSEGTANFRNGFSDAEVQALYSRAIDPYFNLQAGVRQDLASKLHETYGAFGFEGLAPYWFEVSGAAFVSTRGHVLGRLEGYYDQNITQRLILQPRVELNFAAQNVPEDEIGVGLINAELGLRLRYEITREIAPYIGVSYDTKVGQTAAYASQDGKPVSNVSFVAGLRVWF